MHFIARALVPVALLGAISHFQAMAGSDVPAAVSDPFAQATSGFGGCPAASPPVLSAAELRSQEHVRVQHGTSCYRSGRCRLPNSYLYDAEIVPRVALYLREDGRFADTSVWVLSQRRLVTLMGCVRNQEQFAAMERAVMLVDDVMGVINQLSIGSGTVPAPLPGAPETRQQ